MTCSASASSTIDTCRSSIGRRETNDLRLGGSEVSREHAEIVVRRPAAIMLRDRESRYGTFVNGEPVTRVRAAHRATRSGSAGAAAPTSSSSPPTTTAQPLEPVDDRRARRPAADHGAARGLPGPGLRPRAAGSAGARARRRHRDLRRRARVHHAVRRRQRARVQARARPRQADADRQHVRRSAARCRKRCSGPARRKVVADLLDGGSPTCTWARSRSASATSSACR